MAKQKNFDNLAVEFSGRSLTAFFNNTEPFEFTVESATEVIFVASNDFTMVLKGTGFDSDETGLTSGKITSATLFNAEDQKLATLTGFSINAATFHDKMLDTDTTSVFMKMALKGDDTLTASDLGDTLFSGKGDDVLKGGDGQDFLFGGRGKDKITGGGEADIVVFNPGDGKETITDFDISGDDHDFIQITFEMFQDVDIKKSGRNNTLLDFGDGDTILLLDVRRGQFVAEESFIL